MEASCSLREGRTGRDGRVVVLLFLLILLVLLIMLCDVWDGEEDEGGQASAGRFCACCGCVKIVVVLGVNNGAGHMFSSRAFVFFALCLWIIITFLLLLLPALTQLGLSVPVVTIVTWKPSLKALECVVMMLEPVAMICYAFT